MIEKVSRNAVVALLGTPGRTEGSLNEPREREENGYCFNEKWTYENLVGDPAGVPERVIYWKRYDFVATTVRASAEEPWRPDEKLAAALAEQPSRLAPIDPAHNPPVTPKVPYLPVSKFPGKPDLGGYFVESESD